MSKMGDKVLTEKTRIFVTISNFFLLIGAIISSVVFIVNWKADIEHRLTANESEITEVKLEVKNGRDLQITTQTTLAQIQTDIKWLRLYLEDN